LRFDPNGVWSTEQAIRFGQAIEGLRNDYLEDPVFGLNGMRRTRQMVRVPLATNTVVVNFEQLAANALDTAVDVILLDTTFWGGIRACVKAAAVCETFQLGVAVHSSGELGIQLATMLHLGAVMPNLSFAADAHYHHLTDDIIEGGPMPYETAPSACPKAPAWACGSTARNCASITNCTSAWAATRTTRIPARPGWTPIVPNDRWADPADDRPVAFGAGGEDQVLAEQYAERMPYARAPGRRRPVGGLRRGGGRVRGADAAPHPHGAPAHSGPWPHSAHGDGARAAMHRRVRARH
jgi:glucarate dehydratase